MRHMTFRFTRQIALELGLLVCKCGHKPHNHYDEELKSSDCVKCDCEAYTEIAVRGGEVLE